MKRKIKSLLVILAIVSAGLLMSILLLPNLYVSKVKVGSIPLYEYEKTCYMNCDKLKVNTFEDLLSVSSALSVNDQRIKDSKINEHQLKREEKMKILREGRLARKKEARRLELIEERKRVEALELRKAKHKETIASKPVEVSRGNGISSGKSLGAFNVSAYTSGCYKCSGVSAVGVDLRGISTYQGYKVVASDWSVLPPFSIIDIEGYGRHIVLDSGGKIRGSKLDMLVSSKEQAIQFGRRNLNVTLVRYGR